MPIFQVSNSTALSISSAQLFVRQSSLLRLVPFLLFFDGYLKWFVATKSLADGVTSAVIAPILGWHWLDSVAFSLADSSIAPWSMAFFERMSAALVYVSDLVSASSAYIFLAIGSGGADIFASDAPGGSADFMSELTVKFWSYGCAIFGVERHIDGAAVSSVIRVAGLVVMENAVYLCGIMLCLWLVSKLGMPLLRCAHSALRPHDFSTQTSHQCLSMSTQRMCAGSTML